MKKVLKKHPLAIRWFHWINFPILAVMVWSGLLIYWAYDVYRLGWGDTTVLNFFPDSFYEVLNVPYRLAEGMNLHFVFMWLFAINGLLYFLYLIFSGEWRLIVPGRKSFKESWQVVLHDLHIRKTAPPQKKYNAAQRIAYTGVIIMGFGSLITGLAIFKPVQFHLLTAMLGGYEWARAEHFTLTILFALFFIIHILQVALAGWNNFRSMVTGFDILPGEKGSGVKVEALALQTTTGELKGNSVANSEESKKIDADQSREEPVAKTDQVNSDEDMLPPESRETKNE